MRACRCFVPAGTRLPSGCDGSREQSNLLGRNNLYIVFFARPAEFLAGGPHLMHDHNLLDKVAKSAVGFVHTIARNALRRRLVARHMVTGARL